MPGNYQGEQRRDRRDDQQRQQRGRRDDSQQSERRRDNEDRTPRWKKWLLEVTTEEKVRSLIRSGGKPLVEEAEKLGLKFKQGRLTTNQIRNIFGMVKQMEMSGFDPHKFILLKPKLAYAAARANEDGARQFAEVMTWAIDEVSEDGAKFVRFVDFFEAILAYHKAAGGK